MSMSDFVTCAFGSATDQTAMVRRWIDAGEHIWAARAIDGVRVHIHTETRDGLNAGVNVSADEATVLADYAAERGHPATLSLAAAWREAIP